jgi:hypothetical protein
VLKSRSIKQENGSRELFWFECGKKLSDEEISVRSAQWVDSFLSNLDYIQVDKNVKLPVWGTFAMLENEGGFNECALDFQSRKWAAENGVVDKFAVTYSREDVWKIVSNKKFKEENRKADLTPFQVRYRAAKLDKSLFDYITTMDGGIRYGMQEMVRRMEWYVASKRGKVIPDWMRPWFFWPGKDPMSQATLKYDQKITKKAVWLGARSGEI